MLITKTIEIDMGHRVPNHKSKCRNLHGHRYKIEVGVNDKIIKTKGVSNEGMVIDYGELKEILMQEIDAQFDHGFVLYNHDEFIEDFLRYKNDFQIKIVVVAFIPTAENLAQYWYELLEDKLREKQIKISHVKVWETPSSTAIYEKK